jgi:hypothetical protein
MRWPRLLGFFLLAGAISALVGGFLAGMLFALIELGLIALLPPGLMAGFFSAIMGLRIMLLPAVVLGGLLWSWGIRNRAVWVGTGVLAGLGCFAVLTAFPERVDDTAVMALGPDGLIFAPIFAIAGAPAALVFRLLMEALTAFDEPLGSD